MALLAADNVRFAYGQRTVLQGLSLRIGPGEIVGLVGPNGSGKTTLLRCVCGLLTPQGSVLYGSTPLAALSPRAAAALRAYVPQASAGELPYSVREIIGMGLAHRARFYGAPPDIVALDQVVEDLALGVDLDQRFDRLSGGEQQLVLLARALVQESPLLLLDEPTSHLDLRHQSAVVGVLRRRAAHGSGVLVILHDLNLAALLCHRLYLMAEGKLVIEGAPMTVLRPEPIEQAYGAAVVCGEHSIAHVPVVQLDPRAWA